MDGQNVVIARDRMMTRSRSQQGYTRFFWLIFLLVALVVGYLGFTFWPAVRSYFRIRSDIKSMANQALAPRQTTEKLIREFLEKVGERERLALTRSDVRFDRPTSDRVDISVQVKLPYRFPLTEKQRFWDTTVETTVERLRGH
jgi:hypothetical protein